MTRPHEEEVDWDSFLDMDAVGEPTYSESSWEARRTETPVPVRSHTDSVYLDGHEGNSSAGETRWPQAPVADMLGGSESSVQIPQVSPPMQTIDSEMQMDESSIRSDPRSGAVDHLFPFPVHSLSMDTEMTWLGSDDGGDMRAPLGSFVQPIPARQPPMSYPALRPPSMIDPTLMMNPDRSDAAVRKPDGEYEEETKEDAQLRNALLNFNNDRSQDWEQNSPRSHYDPQPYSPEAYRDPNRNQYPVYYDPTSPQNRTHRPARPFHNPSSPSIYGNPLTPLPRLASPTPPPAPRRNRAKSGSKSKSRSTTPFNPQAETQGPCLTCGKNYRTSTSPGRCGRCGLKWERRTAGPPTYFLDPAVHDIKSANGILYPPAPQSKRDRDDDIQSALLSEPGIENEWMGKWLEAINTPVQPSEDEDRGEKASWAMNQQITFNQKAKMDRDGEYSPTLVTARLRALWQENLVFHGGSERPSSYPIGGDSAGYTGDRGLGFGERLEAVRAVMEVDKRTVMDVVEGRGVKAFVGNPWGFHRRKDSNNGCNIKKKDVLRRAGRKRARSAVAEEEDDEDEEWDREVDLDGGPVETAE